MKQSLARRVWARAGNRCEYCLMPVAYSLDDFEIDHVTPIVHGGPTRFGNLALACYPCNCFKGPNLSGIDPRTKRVVRLFHPRLQQWRRHFAYRGAVLVGRTAIGRATIRVLRINQQERVGERRDLLDEGHFPVV
jgi:hypothetical protein